MTALAWKRVEPLRAHPRTAEDFRRAQRDGRRVWLGGSRLASPLDSPVLAPVVDTLGALLALHASREHADLLMDRDDAGQPCAAWSRVPRTAEELQRQGRISTLFAHETLGMMGRLWDASGSFVNALHNVRTDAAKYRPEAAAVLEELHTRCGRELLLVALAAIEPPPVDGLPQGLRIVDRGPDGIVVSGTKAISTGAPYCDELLLLKNVFGRDALPPEETVGVVLKPSTPGLSLFCREGLARGPRSELGRYDEVDALVVLDRVVVPWERVLYAGEPDAARVLLEAVVACDKHAMARRLVAKLELLWGLGEAMTHLTGSRAVPAVAELLAGLGKHHALMSTLVEAAESRPEPAPGDGGGVLPERKTLHLALSYALEHYPSILDTLRLLGGQSLVVRPSPEDLAAPEVAALYARHLKGSTLELVPRARLWALADELTGSELAGRQRLMDSYAVGGRHILERELAHMLDPSAGVARLEARVGAPLRPPAPAEPPEENP
ncbi:4-hydroxyphenylacetate 3-hydroxylase N-terminal domain-containing protein [Corallococcus llansteffanensis]|uniref:4-hydroxyphenylacetate 3-hydroxylase n=1 Tax=Corallococcus llansteffanensis TaxID=2316731 RepID=A0A3A8PZF8_9BACT|nr:4-hydroxyphenylacetate 3-hydroxylase N-terminal domain-containing protein [Corallococcus llansteffanensis]RKH61889.1 hypothetical protein D7V93_10945 [Corallococcus llansteffanensis]